MVPTFEKDALFRALFYLAFMALDPLDVWRGTFARCVGVCCVRCVVWGVVGCFVGGEVSFFHFFFIFFFFCCFVVVVVKILGFEGSGVFLLWERGRRRGKKGWGLGLSFFFLLC